MAGTAPGGIKAAMNLLGVPVGPSRAPIAPLTAEQKQKVLATLERVKEN
jgi:dihydrodipicolinate synthase/N-acetylneuraminate lyase